MLIRERDIWLHFGTLIGQCRCATSWCDLHLTFDFAVVALTFKTLSGLYLEKLKV